MYVLWIPKGFGAPPGKDSVLLQVLIWCMCT